MTPGDHELAASRIVISGYYGFDNAGDEAILQSTIQGIGRHLPGAEVVVLSANPAEWSHRTGVRCVARYSPKEVWSLMGNGGLFVSGGGGLFQDTTSRRSLYYYLSLLELAHRRGMKTMVYAQGLGPLNRASSRAAVRSVLRHVDQITFRDEDSARLLSDIGLPGGAVVTSDPAFALEPASPERAAEILSIEGAPADVPRLAIAVRPWMAFSNDGRRALAAALAAARDRERVHLLFLNMHRSDDCQASAEIASLVGGSSTIVQGDYTPAELAAVLGTSQALVAMRLHAMILAANAGVPCLAISYDPKVAAMARKLAMGAALDVRSLDPQELEENLRGLLAADLDHRSRIRSAALQERQRAEENFAIMARLCGPA